MAMWVKDRALGVGRAWKDGFGVCLSLAQSLPTLGVVRVPPTLGEPK